MATVMKASEFIERLKDIATNYKTLYVMGCFGAPMTAKNKNRYCDNHKYNRQASRTKLIQAASADTFGFDCVCLIKGVLWGWNGDKNRTYGGAQYAINGVPDIDAGAMINVCSNISTDFTRLVPGEAVWTDGHIGVYIGNGLAIESTPSWKNKVQITAVKNMGTKSGYNARTWKKHGKLPYIEYDVTEKQVAKPSTKPAVKPDLNTGSKGEKKPAVVNVKVDAALKVDSALTGSYKVTATKGLHLRTGANAKKTSLKTLPHGTVVKNYGYYNIASNGVKWLYVKTSDGIVGYCSSTYLKKC